MGPLTGMRAESAGWSAFDTILVIEDDEDTREMLTICIELETSCRVMSLPNAEEVFQHLPEIQESHPCLFVIDYQLLACTGLELYDSLHALKEFEHIPAIITTAATLNLELERAVEQRKLTLLLKP